MIVVVGWVVVITAVVAQTGLFFHDSPLRWLDPSVGPVDEPLMEAMRAALLRNAPSRDAEGNHGYRDELCLPHLSRIECIDRLSSVGGWDMLVGFPAYASGLPDDELGKVSGWWLRHQLANTDGPLDDGFVRVLVVRGGAVVGRLLIHGHQHFTGVLKRSP